jgi:hypothetical protein
MWIVPQQIESEFAHNLSLVTLSIVHFLLFSTKIEI